MSAASCASGDFSPYLRGLFKAAENLAGQARAAAAGMTGASGKRQEHQEPRRGGPWARRGGSPWEKAFGWPGSGGPGGPGGPGFGGSGFGGSRGWWPGPPAPPRGPKAGRGDVRAAILALLREGPRNGYQIMSEIEERSEGAWRPSPGAVYPALSQLADEGLIEAEESGGRRTFRLTDEGRRYVESHPEAARAAWESMAHESGEVPGLFVQAARLGGAIVQVAREGTPEQIHEAEALLEEARRTMYQILAGQAEGEQ